MTFRPVGVSASLVLADNDTVFSCELAAATLNPSPDWINTLCPPGSWPDVGWTLDLTYFAGTESDDGISLDQYLFDHYGEHVDFTLWPYGQERSGFTGLCSLAPGPIGGSQGEWPQLGVSLPVEGQPDQIEPAELALASAQTIQIRHRRVLARSRRRWW